MSTVPQFLETLFPDLRGGFIEIRAIHPMDHDSQPHFYPSIEALCARWAEIDALAKHFNVYFGVCPRSRQQGTKDAVRLVWCLWADVDAKLLPGGKTEALKHLREFPLPPTAIIDSGHGYHPYWRLKEAEQITGPEGIIRLEAYLKALAHALVADPSAAELARVLRLPGTQNLKDSSALLPVTIVELEPNRQYNLSDFEAFLNIPTGQPKTLNKPGWMAEALTGLTQGNRNSTFAKVAGRLHRAGFEPEDIVALLKLHAQASGFSTQELRREIEALCCRYPTGKSSPSSSTNKGETETESKPLQAMPLAAFLESGGQTTEWCVERILPKEGAGILAGPAGYGKSWMLLDLAIEAARGGKWLGQFPTTATKVLYLDEESSPGLLRKRLRKLLGGKKLSQGGLDVHFCVGQGFSLSRSDSVEQLRILLSSLHPGLVIIDSLIRVHRAEENSASEMARVFEVVKNLIREFSCTFLFADHQRKPGNFGTPSLDLLLRGSSEKAAFVDTLLSLQRKEEALIVEHSKSRYDEAVPAFIVNIKDQEPDTTTVAYAGEAEAFKQETRLETAREFLETALRSGEWVARQALITQAKDVGVSEKTIDEALKTLKAAGRLDREDRKTEGGRGGKTAHYRWKPISSPSQSQEVETETE